MITSIEKEVSQKLLFNLALIVLLVWLSIAYYIIKAKPCFGGDCPSWSCFSSSECGGDCYCLKTSGENRGVCASHESN